jgi:hypothetical protein
MLFKRGKTATTVRAAMYQLSQGISCTKTTGDSAAVVGRPPRSSKWLVSLKNDLLSVQKDTGVEGRLLC